MTKNDALRVIGFNGNPAAQWVGNVLLTSPRFSAHAAKRLKFVALLVTLDFTVDLTREWEPVINGLVMPSWESFDGVCTALYKNAITPPQFKGLIESFGTPWMDNKGVPHGLGRMLLDMLGKED